MYNHKYIYVVLFFVLIPFFNPLLAQDSLAAGKMVKIHLKSGDMVEGKIIETKPNSLRLQQSDGKIINIPYSFIYLPDTTQQKIHLAVIDTTIDLMLKDGKSIRGKITSVNDSTVTIKTSDDIIMFVPVSKILKAETINEQLSEGGYYRKDPNQSHLFFAPTAQPVEAGKIYFSDYMVFFPTLSGGIANIFSIGGGISLLPFTREQLFYLGLKATILNYSFDGNNLSLAAGAMTANLTSTSGEAQSIFYGVSTFRRNNYAFTLGLIESASNNSSDNSGLLLLGGELRISNSVKLMSEDYVYLGNGSALYSFGLRFFGENIAGDFGLFTTVDQLRSDTFPFIPWLAFTYNF